jgi:hypothetical protein
MEQLLEDLDKLCKENYEGFKKSYPGIPTKTYAQGTDEGEAKIFCNGQYEIWLSRQGIFSIVRHPRRQP